MKSRNCQKLRLALDSSMGVYYLELLQLAELQDKFGDLYDQYVELSDLIAEHVSKAVQ